MSGACPTSSAVDSNSRMSLFRQHWYSSESVEDTKSSTNKQHTLSVSRAWHAVPSAVCYMARKQTSISVWSCIVKSFRTRPKLMYARMFYNSRLSEGLSSHLGQWRVDVVDSAKCNSGRNARINAGQTQMYKQGRARESK